MAICTEIALRFFLTVWRVYFLKFKKKILECFVMNLPGVFLLRDVAFSRPEELPSTTETCCPEMVSGFHTFLWEGTRIVESSKLRWSLELVKQAEDSNLHYDEIPKSSNISDNVQRAKYRLSTTNTVTRTSAIKSLNSAFIFISLFSHVLLSWFCSSNTIFTWFWNSKRKIFFSVRSTIIFLF